VSQTAVINAGHLKHEEPRAFSLTRSWRRGLIVLAVLTGIASGALVAIGEPIYALACVAALFIVLLMPSPGRMLLLVACLWAVYWLPGIPVSYLLDFKEAVLLAMLFLTLGLWLVRDHRVLSILAQTPTAWILGAFMLTLIPGVVVSEEPLASASVWLQFAAAALIYAALRYLFKSSAGRIELLFKLLVLSVTLSAVYVLLVQVGLLPALQPPSSYVGNPALMGFSYRPSGLSWAIGFVAPIAATFSMRGFRQRRWSGVLWGLVCICLVVTCGLTRGRGGLLAAFLGIGVVLLSLYRGWKGKAIVLLLIAAAVLFLMLTPSFVEANLLRGLYGVEEVTGGIPSRDVTENLASGRLAHWRLGLQYLASSPLVGLGLGQYSVRLGYPILETRSHMHNLFLGTAVEAGLPAGVMAVLFFAYVLFFYRPSAAGLRSDDSLYFGAASYGVIVASLAAAVVEIGPMFHSLYLGLPFWFALAAVDALRVRHP
jgi:O-antigen ligase